MPIGRFNLTISNRNSLMDGKQRNQIKLGAIVQIVQKHHQRSGELTEGEVAKILTSSAFHPHGIKVRLTDGKVGRVQAILN